MARHFIEVRSISDWQSRLGDPELHWRRGASAMELAITWTLARRNKRGMPDSVAALLDSNEELAGATVDFAIPELRTTLPGGSTSSQTDLWALLRAAKGKIALSVEGKAREPFGDTVERWLGGKRPDSQPSPGRGERIEFLAKRLGLASSAIRSLRYQLLHRTVAALLEAERWGASAAVMLVQRFANRAAIETPSWADFEEFCSRLGATVQPGQILRASVPDNIPLYLAWLDCAVASDAEAVAAMTDSYARSPLQRNAFEALCSLAAKENWCWRLTCTTCGCMHFRYALLELSQGKHPDSPEWITRSRSSSQRLQRDLGAISLRLPMESQRETVALASRVRIRTLATSARFPDWLGYLGIVLNFCSDAEGESRSLTKTWSAQLADMLVRESALKHRLQERATGTGLLSLGELDEIEHEMQHSQGHS